MNELYYLSSLCHELLKRTHPLLYEFAEHFTLSLGESHMDDEMVWGAL